MSDMKCSKCGKEMKWESSTGEYGYSCGCYDKVIDYKEIAEKRGKIIKDIKEYIDYIEKNDKNKKSYSPLSIGILDIINSQGE